MILFVVGGAAAARAVTDVAARLPFFPGRPVERFSAGRFQAAWVQHEGLSYAHADGERFALFAGRPFGAPLDPAAWLRDQPDADGRFAFARLGASGWEVGADPLGAYPLFETAVDGERYVSNNAEALRVLRGTRALSLDSLAGLLGGGWPLDGNSAWDGVRRVNTPRGGPVAGGAPFDADGAAARLVDATRALADWPGRPVIVPVTGGRDSRVVLAAAVAAGIDFETRTGGVAGHPDVEIGRALAEAVGARWRLLEHDPHGSLEGDWRRAAELLWLTTGGTASLSDAIGFPFGPRPGPLPLWLSGQGGEVARSYYGSDADLYAKFTGRRPGRAEILNDEGRARVRAQIDAFVEDQIALGAPRDAVPDLFYLWRRMGTWAGPTHGAVEFVRDTTSPLWNRATVADMLAARGSFHGAMLERLAPRLIDIPYEGAPTLAKKLTAELRRRLSRGPRSAVRGPHDEIRDLVLDQQAHPAWALLDRARVEQLLRSDAAALDTMSRYYVWRLATVFSAPL